MQYCEVNYSEIKTAEDGNLDLTAEKLVQLLQKKGWKIATAESCTGGLAADAIVSVAGASGVFDGGIISYANRIKENFLGVKPETLSCHGAVSPQCAAEMAEGIREKMQADIGISTTGIAGPDGGTPEKPVGLVYVGIATGNKITVFRLQLTGNRKEIREKTVKTAINCTISEIL